MITSGTRLAYLAAIWRITLIARRVPDVDRYHYV